ncbi:Uncharacterized protein dnm_057780 [Desulfonema magnum]|uniref:Uncharacterized protein n=2 Tax=Desulfonema magnum TaxID=45655 RepID=A0A975BQD5_9BACT|nr:Uncharacterized protein dnm_057780 [Desulfonema magnum]
MIAKDLYRLMKEVEELEKQIENASFEKCKKLKDQLRKTKAEQNRMHRILEGSKDTSPPYPKIRF